MKKLIVCGDSFMSPRLYHKETHFSEIFAKALDFDLIVYARSAMSNGGIILQILQAIDEKPDLIFFSTTNSDRIEFPIDPLYKYNRKIQIQDIQYKSYGKNETSCIQHNLNGNIISDNLTTLLNNAGQFAHNHKIPKERLDAVKKYFEHIYIDNWKWQQDCMMMYFALHQLYKSNIPYIWCFDFLNLFTGYPLDWVEDKNLVLEKFYELRCTPPNETYRDPGYHTSYETQKLMADFIIEHYDKYFKPVD